MKRAGNVDIKQISGEEALSVLIEAKLTRHQYNIIQQKDKAKFPCYSVVQQAKKECYPDDITITSSSAEVKLQSLLNHTVTRLLEVQKEVVATLTAEQLHDLKLISRWGFDGSSGHSRYKQKFDDDKVESDENILLTSFVPLRLTCSNNIIIWQNPRPSSPRFCRPIRLRFVHETADISIAEERYIQNQTNTLNKTIVTIDDNIVGSVNHELLLTMIDGKVCNAVTETKSTQRCFICGATTKDFNNLNKLLCMQADPSKMNFGLSILHCWIRFFECLLHLGYKLSVKKWQARGDAEKKIVSERKQHIQNMFKKKMGLLIDCPKAGYGSTNDGNTARRFFLDHELSSSITGVDFELIKRFYVILQTISSGYEVNVAKFKEYTIDTAKLFVDKYPWYFMPPSVHKVLIHGPDVIATALLPIGQLSEEAQEARHKDIKKYREGYSRKSSRTKTMEDVFKILLISSDPKISSMRELPKRTSRKLSPEVVNMLYPPRASQVDNDDVTISSSDDDEETD